MLINLTCTQPQIFLAKSWRQTQKFRQWFQPIAAENCRPRLGCVSRSSKDTSYFRVCQLRFKNVTSAVTNNNHLILSATQNMTLIMGTNHNHWKGNDFCLQKTGFYLKSPRGVTTFQYRRKRTLILKGIDCVLNQQH